jgi:hypothetical protein
MVDEIFEDKYRVSVRIGFYEFHCEFAYEKPALDCFESIANTPDVEIVGDAATVGSDASVADVTIRRFPMRLDIGNPHRR